MIDFEACICCSKSHAIYFRHSQRIPLYLVVGGTFASAVTFLTYNRSQHPQVPPLSVLACCSHFTKMQNAICEAPPEM